MLAAAQASRLSDEDVAREIAPLELAERLTETTLSGLSSGQGNRTKRILRTLADESAFLDPPASELSMEAPPTASEQKAILARASDYAAAYKHSLPEITCTKTTHRFNDNPSEDKQIDNTVGLLLDVSEEMKEAWRKQVMGVMARLRERDSAVRETTVNHGDPAASAEFGNLIGSVFLDDGAARAVWSHWETIDGKRLPAFNYAIDPADSDFILNSCCVQGQGGWPRDNVAYRGSLLIEPTSGVIFRITLQAMDNSPGATAHRSDAVIEYRAVNIGGESWMCPYRTITLSDSTVGPHGRTAPVRTLDTVEFTNYHTAGSAPSAVPPRLGPPEVPPRGKPVTVRQLEQMLTSAHEARRSDNDIAMDIGRVDLTERLTEATLSNLSQSQRKLTKATLQILADESAFLDPPPSELPADSPPGVDQQKAIMAQASAYASAYIHNLPNFICKQVIRRLDNDPARQKAEAVALLSDQDTAAWRMQSQPHGAGGLTERDTVTNELTIRNGTESHRHASTVSTSPFAGGPYAMQGLTTSGEFGGIIGSVFSANSDAKAVWSHWEIMAGKHATVFNYTVDLAHSDFVVDWCCVDKERRKERVAYRGEVFIDPDSGGILRISWQALNISDLSPTRSSDTVVDYRPVEIGGSSWLCPVRSVTKMDSTNQYHVRGANLYVRSLNQVEFIRYHKFGSDARMVSGFMSPPDDISAPVPPEPENTVTVKQLAEILTSARRPDDKMANEISKLTLTERLTSPTLSNLSRGQGKRTQFALHVLADESQFLDPPAAELPAKPSPSASDQKAILAQASNYARAYIGNLPNFTCTQTTHRLDNDPSHRAAEIDADSEAIRAMVRAYPVPVTERDTVSAKLTFDNGADAHRHISTVAVGRAPNGTPSLRGLITSGEFGGIIQSVFSSGAIADAVWSHWETIDGKLVAVFKYSVDFARSTFFLYWQDSEKKEQRVAYRGAVFIEPNSGSILRISWQAVDVPPAFPMHSSETVVDYRSVEIGGGSWLCPVRSVTISGGGRFVSLNRVEFTDYHRFGSDARILRTDIR